MTTDDKDLDRLASNNPAMTIPASSQIDPTTSLEKSKSRTRTLSNKNKSPTDLSDPAGTKTDMDLHRVISSPLSTPLDKTAAARLTKYDTGWRRVVRNFSPSWFSVTMGTGIVSLLLLTIPFQSDWLYWLSVSFFILNTVLFTLAFGVTVLRYTLYPEIWDVMIHDPTNSLFLGTIPMGFATLIESWIFLVCPYWGYWSVTFVWICWMVDAIVAAAVTVSLPYLLMSQSHQQTLERITAAQLLPIAATIVASGAGAEIAPLLHNSQHAFGTLITSYVMWGMSTPLAMTVLVMYYQRLALHKLPPREVVVSSFLPLGPLGMGGYTIMYLGKVAREIIPEYSPQFFSEINPPTLPGDILYIIGFFLALMMWGFGLVWMVFALATISHARPFPFNMGWWGFTFPLGVFSISTMTFGVEMPSMFFKVLGTIFAVMVIILWAVVAAGTARGAWTGQLFHAPCLKNLRPEDRIPKHGADADNEKLSAMSQNEVVSLSKL